MILYVVIVGAQLEHESMTYFQKLTPETPYQKVVWNIATRLVENNIRHRVDHKVTGIVTLNVTTKVLKIIWLEVKHNIDDQGIF
jgi:hypothetical protein